MIVVNPLHVNISNKQHFFFPDNVLIPKTKDY